MTKRMDTDPDALRQFRERRGWTHEQMADAVEASPLEVVAWEAGTVRVPERPAAWVRWFAAYDARHARVLEAGIGECPWVRKHAPGLYERMLDDRAGNWVAERSDVLAHFNGCRTCQSFWRLALRLPVLPAPPGPDFDTLGARYHRAVDRLPWWLQPPLRWIAALPFGAVALALFRPDPDSGWPATLAGLLFAVLCLLGGFVLGREGVGRLSAKHPYLGGVLLTAAGVGAGLLLWEVQDAAFHATDARVLAGAGLAAVTLGLLAGAHAARRNAEEHAGAELPPPSATPLPGGRVPEPDLVRASGRSGDRAPAEPGSIPIQVTPRAESS
jgi:DNA-binding XRE family transcriptional regulator